ncbi:MAG: hypothetical protein MJ159_03780 [Treponemataceae bacterium]|nr:hypothetical protein [Treponemataceae bacterium]
MKISPRGAALIGGILTFGSFFIYDKFNLPLDVYIITLGIIAVIVEFSYSIIWDYNEKKNRIKRRIIIASIFLIAVIITSILKVKTNMNNIRYLVTVGILYLVVAIIN